MPNIFIAGYYGFHILGDEAVLAGMLRELSAVIQRAKFTVTSADPSETSIVHSVSAVDIRNISAVLQAIRQSDMVILGGGGVFNEYFPYRNKTAWTLQQDFNVLCGRVPIMAAAVGKPCVIYAVGIEPLYTDIARKDCVRAFDLAAYASVRDKESRAALRKYGFRGMVEVTCDPSVAMVRRQPSRHKTARRLVVSLRHWNTTRWDPKTYPNAWEKEMAAGIDAIIEQHDIAETVFVPFQVSPELGAFADDIPVLERVSRQLQRKASVSILKVVPSPVEYVDLVMNAMATIGMRFHSVKLSLACMKPTIAISYSKKVRNAMFRAEMSDFILPLRGIRGRILASRFSGLLKKQAAIHKQLERVRAEDLCFARKTAESVAHVLASKHERNPDITASLASECVECGMRIFNVDGLLQKHCSESKNMEQAVKDLSFRLQASEQQLAHERVARASRETNAARFADEPGKLRHLKHLMEPTFLLSKISTLKAQGITSLAIYGAGAHTRRILKRCHVRKLFSSVLILDDNPALQEKSIAGIPVVAKLPGQRKGLAILISSDSAEDILYKRAKARYRGCKILRLYGSPKAKTR